MKGRRSTYTFNFNCEPEIINQIMQNYLIGNEFILYTNPKDNEQYYRAGNELSGYWALTYSIVNNTMTINAWLDGTLGNFPLEQSNPSALVMNYNESLNLLFQEILKYNNNAIQNPNGNQNVNNQQNIEEFARNYQNNNLKNNEKVCEIGFWLSILGVFLSLIGITYGVIVYILNFYFASLGLNTKKRNKAIATIVLSILSIVITIIELIILNT